jgi:hypothetical protein
MLLLIPSAAACLYKLLTILIAMIRDGKPWASPA